VCVSSGCTSNAQCPPGTTCQGGACVSSGRTSNAQCPPGTTCQGGACVSAGCTSNAQCPAGQVCVSGSCEPGQSTCQTQRGTGSFTVSEAAVATCSAVGTPSANVAQAQVSVGQFDPSNTGPAILLLDASGGQDGLALQLNACPAAAGTLTIGNGVDAYFFGPASSPSANVQLFAEYKASGGSVSFTSVGTTLAGSASLTFDNGGTGTATFTLQ